MVIPATGAPQNRSTTDWPARRWPASTHGGWAAWRDFRLGNLAATGLGDGSVDAVLCVDAILFSQQPDAACCELPRVLGPGGRAVLTCSEPLGQGDERLPGRLWRVDLAARLTAVGFSTMEVRGRLGWRARERAMWQEAAALDPRRRSCAAVIPRRKACAPSKSSAGHAGSSPRPLRC